MQSKEVTISDIHKKAMLEALEKSLGVVSTACRTVDISRQTHYRWLREDSAYRELAEDISEIALDYAESQLHKQITKGNVIATIFYLKTKGKSRGYIERSEIHHGMKKIGKALADELEDEIYVD